MESSTAALLESCSEADLLRLIDSQFTSSPTYDAQLIEAILFAIESRDLLGSPRLDLYLTQDSAWRKSTSGAWLMARLLEMRGEKARANSVWTDIINQNQGPMHLALLARARLEHRSGEFEDAFTDLGLAAQGQDDFAFLSQGSQLYEKLRRQAAPSSSRSIRLAILASTTTDLIAPLLRFACFRDGIDAELWVAPYGNFQQEILNPGSELYSFVPDFVLIATHWRDAHLPAHSINAADEINRVVRQFQTLWLTLLERHPCRIIQHAFDLPNEDSYGHLNQTVPGTRARMLNEINLALRAAAPAEVALLDLERASSHYGKRFWYDASYWHLAKQYPAPNALPLLVDHQVALIRAGLGLTKKVLALDLDNTLWGGVIGEDGLGGIQLGPSSATGEAYQELQQYALELKERGILLAVCSKNNEEDAKLPFLHHDGMKLRLEDFVIFNANWIDKPTNLLDTARLLKLGVDSFVFLDDNPVERALVRRQLPEVAVPEPGADPSSLLAALDRGLYFEAWSVSQEDLRRHASYQSDILRAGSVGSSASLEEFLGGLEMEAETGFVEPSVLSRIVQLIGKTNQFNLTTRRHDEAQTRRMMTSSKCWMQYFRLRDRFGDSGLIGLIIARRTSEIIPTWEIDTWLMSCRVIGRQMEHFMFQTLAEAASRAGIRQLRGVYIPTAKNRMVADLYPKLGFTKLAPELQSQNETRYTFDLSKQQILHCAFIRSIAVSEEHKEKETAIV